MPDNIVDFGWLSKLPDVYAQGQERQRDQQLRNSFSGGLPRGPDGQIDFGKAAEIYAQYGDPAKGLNLVSADQARQQAAARDARDFQFRQDEAKRAQENFNSTFNRPSFTTTGTDRNGNPAHGFVSPATQTVAPYAPAGADAAGGPANDLTGDEFLKTLDPGRANMVKAIVEGRMSPPSGMSLKSPQVQGWVRDAAQYEPGFDLTKWSQRNSTVKDFASGKAAGSVTSLNTVVGHLGDLTDKVDALNNYRIPLANSVGNFVNEKTGDPRVNNFNLARNAVSDELAKVFRQTGMSDHEIGQWKSTLNADMSPEQLKGAVKTAVGLLESRLNALHDQRTRGMNTSLQPTDLLNEKSRAVLQKIGAWANGNPVAPAAAPKDQARVPAKLPPLPPGFELVQ